MYITLTSTNSRRLETTRLIPPPAITTTIITQSLISISQNFQLIIYGKSIESTHIKNVSAINNDTSPLSLECESVNMPNDKNVKIPLSQVTVVQDNFKLIS